jgi:hypothetical protein
MAQSGIKRAEPGIYRKEYSASTSPRKLEHQYITLTHGVTLNAKVGLLWGGHLLWLGTIDFILAIVAGLVHRRGGGKARLQCKSDGFSRLCRDGMIIPWFSIYPIPSSSP